MTTNNPREACEKILLAQKQYNLQHSINPTMNVIIDRFLENSAGLIDSYQDIFEKLNRYPGALEVFFDRLLNFSAYWGMRDIAESRKGRRRLCEVNKKITQLAIELSSLLEERSEIQDSSGFYSETHYHVCDVIEKAASQNYRFTSFVQKELALLKGQFDLKYWPTLSEFIQILALDAENASAEASNRWTEVATEAFRPSSADFFKTLIIAIDPKESNNVQFFPSGFRLKDETIASLGNCALDLPADSLKDGSYVKRLRQRERS